MELRKRLFYMSLSIILWGVAAYFVQQQIVRILLRPAQHQQFIYTSVGGGIDFLFRVCIYTGIVFSIPVIVYQILKYVQPLIKKDAVRFITLGSMMSGVLAIAGMIFGYFVGLPAALHFLLHQFTTDQIHPLLTIQSYMSFVTLYMLGSALLFQLPLILVLINRIKPLKPKKLFGYERWVILIAFLGGGIMNPSPRVQDQLMLAGPIILAYQVGIALVWLSNRKSAPVRVRDELREKDAEQQSLRRQKFEEAQLVLQRKMAAHPPMSMPIQAADRHTPAATAAMPAMAAAVTKKTNAVAHNPLTHSMDVRRAPGTPARPATAVPRAIQGTHRRSFNDFSRRPGMSQPQQIRIQTDSAEAA